MRFGYFISVFLTLGCATRDPLEPEVVSLDHEIFLKNVFQMSAHGNELILNDFENGRVVVLDDHFKLERLIGRKGKGRGELIDPNFHYLFGDVLVVAGNEAGGFNFYNYETGGFIADTRNMTSDPLFSAFFVRDSLIYLSTSSYDKPISTFNFQSRLISNFGAEFPYSSEAERVVRNDRHLIPMDDEVFFSIGISEPIIQTYSYNGELKHEFNFGNIDLVKERLANIYAKRSSEANARNTTYILTTYAVSYKDELLLLVASDKENGLCSSDILVFRMDRNRELHYERMINLPSGDRGRWYSAFAVLGSAKLALFEMYSGRIHVYNTPL